MNALIFNCTLKKSPTVSNTQALIDKVVREFDSLGVSSEVVRIADYHIAPGTSSDEGNGDQWPQLLPKVRACDIFIIATPIWVGFTGSLAQRVIERLDDVFHNEEHQDPKTGQTFFYGKVGGTIVTGNEDGAHGVVARVNWALNEFGCTIPPSANTYWVGKAGPGPSYLDDDGTSYLYTNKTLRHMAHNLAYMAGVLKAHPISTNLNALTEEAKKESRE
ncbi:MAG TPA: flavodoxin family protein [Candidatus Paceibacterota bacterium]|jgi:multimeric flavodoxin WrbA